MRSTGGEGEVAPQQTSGRIFTPLSGAMRPRPRSTAAGPWVGRLRRYGALVAGARAVRVMDQPADERALFLVGVGLATVSRVRHGKRSDRPPHRSEQVRVSRAGRSLSGGPVPRPIHVRNGRRIPLVLGALGAVAIFQAAQEFLAFCLADEAHQRWRRHHRRAGGAIS